MIKAGAASQNHLLLLLPPILDCGLYGLLSRAVFPSGPSGPPLLAAGGGTSGTPLSLALVLVLALGAWGDDWDLASSIRGL